MKKFAAVMLVICLIAALSVAFAACNEKTDVDGGNGGGGGGKGTRYSIQAPSASDVFTVEGLPEGAYEGDTVTFKVTLSSPADSILNYVELYGRNMKFKPGAVVVAARRAGTTASYDVLNKYLQISSMIQVPSTYWNMVFGSNAEQAMQDEEGISVMRAIGSNMAWILKLLENAKGTELERPVIIKKAKTNFIR